MSKHHLTFAFLMSALLSLNSCALKPTKTPTPVSHYTLPYNIWSEPWAFGSGEMRFFDIDMLMKEKGLSRLAAAELQNLYRDYMDTYWMEKHCDHHKNYSQVSYGNYFNIDVMICFTPEVRQTAWDKAIEAVKANKFESGWNNEKLAQAKFVVAFDLDNTLFYQNKDKSISLAPGWKEAVDFVHEKGGAVIFFTAREDPSAWNLINNWQVKKDGSDINIKDYVEAIFTNNHMIMEAGAQGDKPSISVPVKDLRLIEENPTKTFIVDDLPERVHQVHLLRHVTRWENKKYSDELADKVMNDPERLLTAVKEIYQSVLWAESHQTTPAKAFLPYSFSGRQITNKLAIEVFNGDFDKAVEFVRQHPEVVTAIKH